MTHLFEIARQIAPALGNHLWQSTLFAGVAGLLTLVLRNQHARFRYWLWLSASVKFLVPFSLLVALGNRLAWTHSTVATSAGLYVMMDELNQPFAPSATPALSALQRTIVQPDLSSVLSWMLVVWFGGIVMVLLLWTLRWRKISSAMRAAVPLREGREFESLRRLERIGGIHNPIEILQSRASLEPGIFGIARPVLIWPEGISQHLDDKHLEAVLAHELWHVRRYDNLAAAIHMLVEALFWFHPLVWWLGARLVEERERACDEEVVELGSARHVYAESILKVCEFCVGSPLACVAGVTGADLKKRMVYIMRARVARKLGVGRKLLLTAVAVVALAAPIVFGIGTATQQQAQAQIESSVAGSSAYEAASVSPSRPQNGVADRVGIGFSPNSFSARNATLQTILAAAYGVQADLISGPPEFLTQKFDMEVKMSGTPADLSPKKSDGVGIARLHAALQQVLADRFKLVVHPEAKDRSIYALVVAPEGAKLQNANTGLTGMRTSVGQIQDHAASMTQFAEQLSWQIGKTVVDKTGLNGKYDFSVAWQPAGNEASNAAQRLPLSEESVSAMLAAIQQQLGLKLDPQQARMQVLVIDHVEMPSEPPSSGS